MPHLRAPLIILKRSIAKAQRHTRHHFDKPTDWLRLVMLGVILLQLAIVAYASNLLGGRWLDYVPGTANMVAGVFTLFILMRIAQPKVYPIWLTEASLQLALGSIVASDHMLQSPLACTAAILVFLALAIVRLWIATTILRRNVFPSLAAGAGTTLFLICWLLASKLTSVSSNPDVILATDLAIRSISLIMFGLALRSKF